MVFGRKQLNILWHILQLVFSSHIQLQRQGDVSNFGHTECGLMVQYRISYYAMPSNIAHIIATVGVFAG